MHAAMQSKYESTSVKKESNLSVEQKTVIIENLIDLIKSIKWKPQDTEWGDYYTFTNYSDKSMEDKAQIVSRFLDIA